MSEHIYKHQENEPQSAANDVSQKQVDKETTFQLVDNRPEAILQRKFQQMANDSVNGFKIAQPKSKTPAPASDGIIQRHDTHNNHRLTDARVASRDFADQTTAPERANMAVAAATDHQNAAREVRLDHSVSQANLDSLHQGLQAIGILTAPGATKYQALKTAHANLISEIHGFPEWDNHDTINGFLLNMRANLTPGFSNAVNNPGDMFDIQVVEDNGEVSQSPYVQDLMAIDNNLRIINRLSGELPNQHNGVRVEHHNPKLENALVQVLNAITAALHNLSGAEEPELDTNLWYRYNRNWVKKVAAEYIEQLPQDGAEQLWAIPTADTNFQWTIDLPNYTITNDDREEDTPNHQLGQGVTYEADTDMTVNVRIPVATWQHIYERHTIGRFAGDIQAVNTFWKNNPSVLIDQVLLEPELNLMIDRLMNLRNLMEWDSEQMNNTANNLFFQGSITYTDQGELDVEIDSIAPQSSALALAIKPDVLQGLYGHIQQGQAINDMMNMNIE